jgi:endoglucanase
MAKHARTAPRRRVWPVLTATLAAAAAAALLGWTVTGAAGRPLTLPVALTAAPAPLPPPTATAAPHEPPPAAGAPATPTVPDPDASPLAGRQLWVEPTGAAADQAARYEAAGRTADAAAIRRIASQPQAVWFADGAGGFAARAQQVVTAAEQAGKVPVLVTYYRPDPGCDGEAGGGATDDRAYGAWVAALAEALTGHAAVVVLEPDAVAEAVDGCLDDAAAVAGRYRLLAAAIDTLKVNSAVRVYLDAGNPDWITDTTKLAKALRRAGVERADGFALNVAGVVSTADNIAYGRELSDKLEGAHFVVDTSRNGAGSPARPAQDGPCNPPGRALGDPPTTWTGQPRVDAYLWVKRPGESDGACGRGAPPGGVWWPEYALDLATG